MRRLHFYVMGFVALAYGLLVSAEYAMVSYGPRAGWLRAYPPEQLAWLDALPGWVHGTFATHAMLALVGALCLLAHVRAAVWMLAFAFGTLVVLQVWMVAAAEPSVIDLTGGGWQVWTVLGLVLALSFLVYLYARQEKQVGEVL